MEEAFHLKSWRTLQLVAKLSGVQLSSMTAGRHRLARAEFFDASSRLQSDVARPAFLAFKSSKRDEYAWAALISHHSQRGQERQAQVLLEEMLEEGMEPSRHTFVALLKACCRLQDLESARRIHAELIRRGWVSDLHVGTMLVVVYAKCDSLEDARCAFEKMCTRDVVSWSAMILGYAQMGEGGEALKLYRRMVQEGVLPNGRTFVGALKACSSLAACCARGMKGEDIHAQGKLRDEVRLIYLDVLKSKFDTDMFVGNALVDAYAKCGGMEEARSVFEKMLRRDVVSWNTVIFGYAQSDNGEEAIQLYARMQQEGVTPDDRTYVGVLKACSRMAEMGRTDGKRACLKELVQEIHAVVLVRRPELNVFVGSMLVDAYSKCGSLENARIVFDKLANRTVVCWNAMILAYAQTEKGEEALHLFAQMQQSGLVPDDRTYVNVLKACSSLAETDRLSEGNGRPMVKRCLENVRFIHTAVLSASLETDVFVATTLVDAYVKCGSLEDARVVFEKMPRRSVASWNAMILGYAQIDEGDEALRTYAQMQFEGFVPNERTYVAALKACGNLAGLETGKEIHKQIVHAGTVGNDSFVAHSLIDMYSKCGSMVDAQQVFDAMPIRETVAWNALITGYANQGECEVVFALFHRMIGEGVQPNGVTFLGVLNACNYGGLEVRGQKYFEAMSRDYGISPTLAHYTIIIDLVCRSGQLEKAMAMVKQMPIQPDSALWECILGACRRWSFEER